MLSINEKKQLIKNKVSIRQAFDLCSPRDSVSKGKCLCPVHTEAEPSCTVHLNTNYFHCFGCGAKGDIISLVQYVKNVGFVEAIDILCQDFGIDCGERQLSEAEINQKIENERQENIKRSKAQIKKEFILLKSNEICEKLLTLRKRCVILHSKNMLSQYEMDEHTANKERIKRLEDIYLTLNGLGQEDLQLTQNELIDKLKMGVIEL
jgi:hypothetical protein